MSPLSHKNFLKCLVFSAIGSIALRCGAVTAETLPAVTATAAGVPIPVGQFSTLRKTLRDLPLAFEPNVGQAESAARFLARGPGYRLELTDDGARLEVIDAAHPTRGTTLRMALCDSNRHASIVGLDPLTSKTNYLTASDGAQWHTGVANYARVVYRDVYRGVDWVYHGNHGQIEYDFVLAPGSDPRTFVSGFRARRVCPSMT